jgi:hypothetical protein
VPDPQIQIPHLIKRPNIPTEKNRRSSSLDQHIETKEVTALLHTVIIFAAESTPSNVPKRNKVIKAES